MAKLSKREYRFSHAQRVISPKLKGFMRPQREHVKQPMPERKP